MKEQIALFESGNELAAYAAKQINYHVMGYYPITPSTQIAEKLDQMKAEGKHSISLMAAEGEHSAAGICYGASTGGGRVFNATSANGLLYALEQLPVQSGTRFPMVMNVACRTVSGPLSIKGDHSDIMYTLNTGWMVLFANTPQEVYDFNIIGLKLAERVKLPLIVAYDGFFTSHQKRNVEVFAQDETVQEFLGEYHAAYSALDFEHPVSIGSYMNEPDLINNKFQLHQAMEKARQEVLVIIKEYAELSGRNYGMVEEYETGDADVILVLLGSSYHTARVAAERLRAEGKGVGVATPKFLRPFPGKELANVCKHAKTIIIADRQDSFGARGGNLTLELKAALLEVGFQGRVLSRIYGLGGLDFYEEDASALFSLGYEKECESFDYYGVYEGKEDSQKTMYFAPITKAESEVTRKESGLNALTAMPYRLAPGHGACPGCGIPVNVNLLLKGIAGNVVILFQTGCGMVVTTPYPKTAFKLPYVHNLFQNGAATLAGLSEMFHQRQRRGEYPEGDITFIMVSGDGGMDIGMGSALGTALRGDRVLLFEYDNGGYMNTGYQLSYSTPKGAKSATSHLGKHSYGKTFFHKDSAMLMAATRIPYIATVAESNPIDFIKKAKKAQHYATEYGTAYVKALSACPLNWNDKPNQERGVIAAAVDCCYFPLFEIEQGKTSLSYNPEKTEKKRPVLDWFSMMGRTKHLAKDCYQELVQEIQQEIDDRWERLKARAEHPLL